MIQPGLIPLQPNLDFMDTFEPFQGEDGRQSEPDFVSPFAAQSRWVLSFLREKLEWATGRT